MALTAAPPEDVARSIAVLHAAGLRVLTLTHPVNGTWQLAAMSAAPGLLLVAVVTELPEPTNPRLALPGNVPPYARRLLHKWGEGPLPETMIL